MIRRRVYVNNEFNGVLAIDNILFNLTNDYISGRITEVEGKIVLLLNQTKKGWHCHPFQFLAMQLQNNITHFRVFTL